MESSESTAGSTQDYVVLGIEPRAATHRTSTLQLSLILIFDLFLASGIHLAVLRRTPGLMLGMFLVVLYSNMGLHLTMSTRPCLYWLLIGQSLLSSYPFIPNTLLPEFCFLPIPQQISVLCTVSWALCSFVTQFSP